MSEKMNSIIYKFAGQVAKILEGKLVKIILYGSYARGDFHLNSDVDIMILVNNMSDEEIRKSEELLCDFAFDIELETDIHISAIVKNEEHFTTWVNVLPFYMNVEKEGVEIHAI